MSARDPEFATLDKLISAGLGDTPQDRISRSDLARAMRGERVREERKYVMETDPLTVQEQKAARKLGQEIRRARENRGPSKRKGFVPPC